MTLKENKALSLPWLRPAIDHLRKIHTAGRMPHGLLIQAQPGLGIDLLARYAAHLVICEQPATAPCEACKSCTLFQAGTHPDFRWIERVEDAKQLQIDQIRELCEAMTFKSYTGSYKVAVIAEADFMNANAANALLKTLEEPPARTLLVLCSSRPSRLPATILSRCQRLQVAKPQAPVALDWLNAQRVRHDWERLLLHAAGGPLRALELAEGDFSEFDEEMRAALDSLQRRTLDVPGTAERWAKTDLAARLEWLETWLTQTLLAVMTSDQHLPSPPGTPNIRRLFSLLDRVRKLKFELSTSLNMQLAAEELLLGTEAALAS